MTYVEKEIAATKKAMELFDKGDDFYVTLEKYLGLMTSKLQASYEQPSLF